MFESLTSTFDSVRRRFSGKSKLTESNISEALREVRVALLAADVNFLVCKDFIASCRERALGGEVTKGVSPGDQFIKSIHDTLVDLMGPEDPTIAWRDGKPTVILMAGLQGAGKTTTCGKLAKKFLAEGKKPMMVAADVQRPAAIEQLKVLGQQVGVPVHAEPGGDPPTICRNALGEAAKAGCDVIILDTAGRLHIDSALMTEVSNIAKETSPDEIFLVLDSNTGQDAVNSAKEFNETLELTGVIMTKLDSGTRGGAALSVKKVTGKPIKFIGVGEKLDNLAAFHPSRMADRILGMGDVVSLVEKAQDAIAEEDAEKAAKQLMAGTFTFVDFLKMLKMIKNMGPMKDMLKMLPGMSANAEALDNLDEREFYRSEAIILSMTAQERMHPEILNMSRRERVAKGSGVTVEQVHNLVRGFKQMRNQMKDMRKGGLFGKMMNPMKALKKEQMTEVEQLESEGKSILGMPEFKSMRKKTGAGGAGGKKKKNKRK